MVSIIQKHLFFKIPYLIMLKTTIKKATNKKP